MVADPDTPTSVRMEDLVSLCTRRGFIFQSSEIYGGINGFWDYGPLGVELKNNLKNLWWQRVVREREDVVGLDSSIIAHPRTWQASGHADQFGDLMVDCKACKKRFRADQLDFNLMMQTSIGAHEDAAHVAYLRAETCQSIFTDMKRVREVARQKIPFGIAQIGKAFRNEINPRNFTFRSREFEQAELEFFTHPSQAAEWFDRWLEERLAFHRELGFPEDRLRTRPHADDELAHYAVAAVDIEFAFPFGWQEIEGIHHRGDWDLSRHAEYSGKDLGVTDEATKEHYVPMVIETSVGIDRTCLAVLANALDEQVLEGGETRTVLHLPPRLAPTLVAVLPLSKKLAEPARRLARELRRSYSVFYDEAGNIGRRYRRQDEVGTPFCVTIDFETEADGKVTLRDRDSMAQERLELAAVAPYLRERLEVAS
jgi:glycyl-tRNA synthetase